MKMDNPRYKRLIQNIKKEINRLYIKNLLHSCSVTISNTACLVFCQSWTWFPDCVTSGLYKMSTLTFSKDAVESWITKKDSDWQPIQEMTAKHVNPYKTTMYRNPIGQWTIASTQINLWIVMVIVSGASDGVSVRGCEWGYCLLTTWRAPVHCRIVLESRLAWQPSARRGQPGSTRRRHLRSETSDTRRLHSSQFVSYDHRTFTTAYIKSVLDRDRIYATKLVRLGWQPRHKDLHTTSRLCPSVGPCVCIWFILTL